MNSDVGGEPAEVKIRGVLSAECEAELRCWEMASESCGDDHAWIRDEHEGNHVVRVTTSIHPDDLKAMLRYGREQRQLGQQFGQGLLAKQIRELIGVPG